MVSNTGFSNTGFANLGWAGTGGAKALEPMKGPMVLALEFRIVAEQEIE